MGPGVRAHAHVVVSCSASSRNAASARRVVPSMPPMSELRVRRCAPSITFSQAVMFMHTYRFWKVRLMPRRANASGECPATLSPSSRISPPLGT